MPLMRHFWGSALLWHPQAMILENANAFELANWFERFKIPEGYFCLRPWHWYSLYFNATLPFSTVTMGARTWPSATAHLILVSRHTLVIIFPFSLVKTGFIGNNAFLLDVSRWTMLSFRCLTLIFHQNFGPISSFETLQLLSSLLSSLFSTVMARSVLLRIELEA